jgi:hypothetical protein
MHSRPWHGLRDGVNHNRYMPWVLIDAYLSSIIVLLMCFWRVCDVPLISRVSVSADSFCYGIRLPANRFPGSELMIVICGYDRAMPAPSAIPVYG